LLTNHGHALTYTAGHPDARIRDIAAAVGITERSAHRIVSELVDAGLHLADPQGRAGTTTRSTPKRASATPLSRHMSVGQAFAALIAPISALDDPG
jgi:hypothetical protein